MLTKVGFGYGDGDMFMFIRIGLGDSILGGEFLPRTVTITWGVRLQYLSRQFGRASQASGSLDT